MAAERDALLMELFRADQVGGVVPGAAEPQGLDVNPDAFFMDPEAAAKRAAQTGGRRVRRKTQKGGKRRRGRNTLRLNLRAQIRLRSRSQRRH